jgi:hypothetical protein
MLSVDVIPGCLLLQNILGRKPLPVKAIFRGRRRKAAPGRAGRGFPGCARANRWG